MFHPGFVERESAPIEAYRRNYDRGREEGRRFMRVTIVHTPSLLNLRGSEFWVMDVSRLLRQRSLDVKVVNFDYARRYPKDPKEIATRLRAVRAAFDGGGSLTRLSGLSLRLPFSRRWRGTALEAFVDRYLHFLPFRVQFLRLLNQSDVVYYVSSQSNLAYLLVVLGMAILAGRRPVVAGIHVQPRMNGAEVAILKLAAKTGTLKAIHIVNRAHEADLRRIGCRVEYIPNGVDHESFYSEVESRAQQSNFTVLFVGAMTEAKGADLIPDIYSSLKERGIEFTLAICTSGGELSSEIDGWSAGKGDVQFKGFVGRDRISGLYAQASVAIFPSRNEAFPIASLEAQASGTPVVVSPVPGLTQAVIGGKTGIISNGFDAKSFEEAIAEVYSLWKTRREDYLAMCRAAQENVRQNFQWKRTIGSLVGLLQSSSGS